MSNEAGAVEAPAERRPSRRRVVLVVAGALVVAAAAVVAVAAKPGRAPVVTKGSGRAAPTFDVPALAGDGHIRLAAFRGRPVVLNFWASWCVPCRREMPAFQAVHERMGDRVAFVGMNNQDSRHDALNLLRETGVRYPSGYDPEGKVARAYRLIGMPTTVFVSADGRVVGTRTGELSRARLEEAIADVFREP